MNPIRDLWGRFDLRTSLRDGLLSLAPAWVVLLAGSLNGLLLLGLAFPTWFVGNCVLPYDVIVWPPQTDFATCWPQPELGLISWLAIALLLAAVGAAHAWLFGLSIHRAWCFRIGTLNANLADAFALVTGPLLAWVWATRLTDTGISAWEHLVIMTAVPAIAVLWRLLLSIWMLLVSLRYTDLAIAATLRIYLRWEFRLLPPRLIEVHCTEGQATVTGPFDYVDTKRVRDLVALNLSKVVTQVDVQTTLDETAFWRPHRKPLQASGYVSPPIPTLETVTKRFLLGFGAWLGGLGLLLALVLARGPKGTVTSDDLKVLAAQAMGTRAAGDLEHFVVLPSFRLNLRTSQKDCPGLEMETLNRWRNSGERLGKLDGSHAGTIYRIHQLPDGFHVYEIQRFTGTCLAELVYPTLRQAEQSTGQASGWDRIPSGYDWRRVPPVRPVPNKK